MMNNSFHISIYWMIFGISAMCIIYAFLYLQFRCQNDKKFAFRLKKNIEISKIIIKKMSKPIVKTFQEDSIFSSIASKNKSWKKK